MAAKKLTKQHKRTVCSSSKLTGTSKRCNNRRSADKMSSSLSVDLDVGRRRGSFDCLTDSQSDVELNSTVRAVGSVNARKRHRSVEAASLPTKRTKHELVSGRLANADAGESSSQVSASHSTVETRASRKRRLISRDTSCDSQSDDKIVTNSSKRQRKDDASLSIGRQLNGEIEDRSVKMVPTECISNRRVSARQKTKSCGLEVPNQPLPPMTSVDTTVAQEVAASTRVEKTPRLSSRIGRFIKYFAVYFIVTYIVVMGAFFAMISLTPTDCLCEKNKALWSKFGV